MSAEEAQLGPSKKRRRRPMQEAYLDQDAAEKGPVKMFNIRMDAALHRRLKDFAYREDRSMKEIVEESLRGYLDTHES